MGKTKQFYLPEVFKLQGASQDGVLWVSSIDQDQILMFTW